MSISWFTGYVANVVPEESAEFYTKLMQHGRSQGMGGFEVDFLDFNFNLYVRFPYALKKTCISCASFLNRLADTTSYSMWLRLEHGVHSVLIQSKLLGTLW